MLKVHLVAGLVTDNLYVAWEGRREAVLSSVRRSEESGIGLVRRQWAPLRSEIDVTETERGKREATKKQRE